MCGGRRGWRSSEGEAGGKGMKRGGGGVKEEGQAIREDEENIFKFLRMLAISQRNKMDKQYRRRRKKTHLIYIH